MCVLRGGNFYGFKEWTTIEIVKSRACCVRMCVRLSFINEGYKIVTRETNELLGVQKESLAYCQQSWSKVLRLFLESTN